MILNKLYSEKNGENKPKDQDEGKTIKLSFCCCSMLLLLITLGWAKAGTYDRDAGIFIGLAEEK